MKKASDILKHDMRLILSVMKSVNSVFKRKLVPSHQHILFKRLLARFEKNRLAHPRQYVALLKRAKLEVSKKEFASLKSFYSDLSSRSKT